MFLEKGDELIGKATDMKNTIMLIKTEKTVRVNMESVQMEKKKWWRNCKKKWNNDSIFDIIDTK